MWTVRSGKRLHVLSPAKLDGKRDQNSIMLLSKTRWDLASVSSMRTHEHSVLDHKVYVCTRAYGTACPYWPPN